MKNGQGKTVWYTRTLNRNHVKVVRTLPTAVRIGGQAWYSQAVCQAKMSTLGIFFLLLFLPLDAALLFDVYAAIVGWLLLAVQP